MEGKVCKKCGEWKIFSEFYKNKELKDGHINTCRQCKNKYLREKSRGMISTKPKIQILRDENGKTCTKCGEWKDNNSYGKRSASIDGLRYDCNECRKKYGKQWYQENKEVQDERNRNWNKNNIERKREVDKIYARKWRKDNSEHYQNYDIKRNKMRKDYIRNYQKKYRKENRDIYRLATLKRRSYKHHVNFTPFQRKEILKRDNWTCQYCSIKVHDRSTGNWNTPDKAHLDHIIPISKGGNSEPDNLQILCRTCNMSKSDKLINKRIKEEIKITINE